MTIALSIEMKRVFEDFIKAENEAFNSPLISFIYDFNSDTEELQVYDNKLKFIATVNKEYREFDGEEMEAYVIETYNGVQFVESYSTPVN